jgi:hypothetical protein
MRTYASALTLALAAALATPTLTAQNDPVSAVLGAATNVAGGALGNSPGSSSGSSRRSRSRAPTLGTALPANAPRSLLTLTADGYMNVPLETFQNMRTLHAPPYDWSADGCSFGEISGPFRDSFNRACNRHDFGYRNYGGQGLALDRTEGRRTRIDDRLRDDLNGLCRNEHRGITETPCLAAAQAVYAAARSMGRSWFQSGTGRPPSIPTPSVPGFNNGATAGPVPGLPIPGVNGIPNNQPNPASQILTVPTQILNGGR